METKNTASNLLPSGGAPVKAVDAIIAHIKAGGVAYVPSNERWIIIDAKTLAKFEKLGLWVLKADGNGYYIRQGRGSVYVMAGEFGHLKVGVRKAA